MSGRLPRRRDEVLDAKAARRRGSWLAAAAWPAAAPAGDMDFMWGVYESLLITVLIVIVLVGVLIFVIVDSKKRLRAERDAEKQRDGQRP